MAKIVELHENYLYQDGGWIAGRDENGELHRQARIQRRRYDTCVELYPTRQARDIFAPVPAQVRFIEDFDQALRIAERWCMEDA